jgi:pyridoxine 4-dehydrogenase
VASVQNGYSLFDQAAEPVLAYCQEQGIDFIPWFAIGGGLVQGMDIVEQVAARQIALSWRLHHAPNMVPTPGTGSIAYLKENMRAASLPLSAQDMRPVPDFATKPALCHLYLIVLKQRFHGQQYDYR